MASQEQINANRENGKLGGVKTEEGKAVSRYNAIKHGLLSKEVLLEGENEKDLVDLGKNLRADFKPENEIELLLVDRIIANAWRLKRVLSMEQEEVISSDGGLKYQPENYFRYEAMIERGLYKALHELQRVQAARRGEKTPLPMAIDVDVNNEK